MVLPKLLLFFILLISACQTNVPRPFNSAFVNTNSLPSNKTEIIKTQISKKDQRVHIHKKVESGKQKFKNCTPKYAKSLIESKNWNWTNCFGIVEYKTGKWKGWKYEGQFYKGNAHGKGKTFYQNGGIYIGNYKFGKKHGFGTSIYSNKDKYVGEYKKGIREGRGTYYYLANNRFKGDKFIGEYRNDKPNGLGTFYYLRNDKFKGDKFVGEYKNGKRNGLGAYYYFRNDKSKGDKFVGEYKDGKKHGKGYYFYNNGSEFLGEYKYGLRNGDGIFSLSNGRVSQEGVWKNDKFQYPKKISRIWSQTIKSLAEVVNKRHKNTFVQSHQIQKEKQKNIVLLKKAEEEKQKRKALERRLSSLQNEKKKRIELEKKLAALQSEQRKEKKGVRHNEIGSGFYVSKFRHIITNEHVVNKCNKITVGDSMNTQVPADLIASDRRNDLAILQTISMEMASIDTKSFVQKLAIQIVPVLSGGLMRSEDVTGGEQIYVAGYPLGNMVSDQMKLTDGIVSATKGLDNNVSQFEISSVIRKGNSGGPIYDSRGNIVGVVVERFNVNRTDSINFAIKGSTVKQFLSAHNVPTKWSDRQKKMKTKDIYQIASKQTVMVVCHR